MRVQNTFLLLCASFLLANCRKDDFKVSPIQNQSVYSGGQNGTVFSAEENAFGLQVNNLSSQEKLDFFVGNSFFNQNWVQAPSSTTARDGVGPMFNARSCSGCHFKDGRGRPPMYDGEKGIGLLLRLSISGQNSVGGPNPSANYGDQLEDQSVQGVPMEGDYTIQYAEIAGQYPDGTPYSLRKPNYLISNLNYGPLESDIMVSPRCAPQMIGLGLLEAISTGDILAREDVNDADGDGISGKANYVWDPISQSTQLGRFGWKANVPGIYQQVAGAFLGDMGITTWVFPDENCTGIQTDCSMAVNGGTPEIEKSKLDAVVLYSQTLAVPAKRNTNNVDVAFGEQLFAQIQCTKCHVSQMTTSTHSVSALSNQIISPYTDLLLHDMGDGLADNRPDFLADGKEWRTTPLWGIGLIETVNKHSFLLHDGRARSIEEAILWHGGEAENAKTLFMNLNKLEREQVLKFLASM
jgi:CxxC motif-containing protein (DUF1111 family)